MTKHQLIDKICPPLTGNPRERILDYANKPFDCIDSLHLLLGGLIAKYENQPEALKNIKNDLFSLTFEVNSKLNNSTRPG